MVPLPWMLLLLCFLGHLVGLGFFSLGCACPYLCKMGTVFLCVSVLVHVLFVSSHGYSIRGADW